MSAAVANAADGGEASSSSAPAKMSAKQQKLFELRMRMNEGRKMNHMEVAAEKRRATDPEGEAKRQRELADQRAEKKRKDMEEAGEEETDRRLAVTLEQAEAMEKKKAKKEKGKAAFGWDIFNQDSLYKAHKKRLEKLQPDLEAYEASKSEDREFYRDANSLAHGGAGFQPTTEKLESMVDDVLERAEKRNKFSRRRPELVEADVDYINDRNKHYNKKIERAFGEYTKVIKENLERGTAI